MNKEYAHYKNYPANKWRWPNFKPIEFRSKSDNKLMIDPPSMDKLQALRTLIGEPMRITSAYRSPAHNKKVGGAKFSQHLTATAFDIPMKGHDPAQFEAAAREVGFTGFGFYKDSDFIHIDTGAKREWGARWFPVATHYKRGPIPDMAQMPDPAVRVSGIPVTTKGTTIAALIVAAVAAIALKLDALALWFGGLF